MDKKPTARPEEVVDNPRTDVHRPGTEECRVGLVFGSGANTLAAFSQTALTRAAIWA